MIEKIKNYIKLLNNSLLNPNDIYQENILILKPMIIFTVFPYNIEDNKIKLKQKYLFYPALCALFCICVIIYILLSNYIKYQFGYQTHLQYTMMFLQLSFGIICLVSILIMQYIQKDAIINILKHCDDYDKFFEVFGMDYNLQRRKRILYIIIGHILYIFQWLFFLIQSQYFWEVDILFYEFLFFLPNTTITLLMYLYMSVIHSITHRFLCTSKILKSFFKINKLIKDKINYDIKSILNNLLNLCQLIEKINSDFGKLIFIDIVLIFVWTVADFYGIIYRSLINDRIKNISIILAYTFSSLNEICAFVMIYVCDRCAKQVNRFNCM